MLINKFIPKDKSHHPQTILIEASSAQELGHLCCYNSSKKLVLDVNKIGDEGAILITDALSTNGTLKYLHLENNIRFSETTKNEIISCIKAGVEFYISMMLRNHQF